MAKKNISYWEIPFCPETRHEDFYTYIDLKDISNKSENDLDGFIKCRTLGIFQSIHGRFYLTNFNPSGTDSELSVRVSLAYLQTPQPSTVVPYPVQIFGTLQWKNRPVLFATLIQVMTVSTALRLKNALTGIVNLHLVKSSRELQDKDQEGPT